MNAGKLNNKIQFLLLIFYASITLALCFTSTRNGPEIWPDSVNYVRAAENFAAGKGFVILSIDPSGREYLSPFTLWPPLYPFLISLFIRLGIGVFLGAKLVPILSFCFSIFFIFILAKKISDSVPVANISCLISCVFWLFIAMSSRVLSESLYMFLLIIAILCLINFYENEKKYFRWLILSAVFTSLAIVTRYVGLFLFLTGCLVIFLSKKDLENRAIKKINWIFLYSLISLFPISVWFFRNIVLIHSPTGQPFTFFSWNTFLYRLPLFVKTFSGFFKDAFVPIKFYHPFSTPGSKVLLIFILCGSVYFLLKHRQQYFKKTKAIFIYIVLYLCGFILADTLHSTPYPKNIRFISSLCPFIIIAIVYFIFLIANNINNSKMRKITTGFIYIIFLSYILLQAQKSIAVAVEPRGFNGSFFWKYNRGIEWVHNNLPAKSVIFSNMPQVLDYKIGRLAIYLPGYNDTVGIERLFLNKSSLGVPGYIIYFKRRFEPECISLDAINKENEKYKTLELIIEFDDSTIFKFKN